MSAQPDYISFAPRARDEILAQIGDFSPAERSLFHRLCDNWIPRIDADRFLTHAPGSEQHERHALERLMGKLSAAGIGMLTTRDGTSGREPDQIILTEKGSIDYWTAVLDEAIMRILAAGDRVLPLEKRIGEERALPPEHHIVEADSLMLFETYSHPTDAAAIYRIRLMEDDRILFTPRTVRDLIQHSFSLLRSDLVERSIVEEVAKQRDTAIGEVRRQLESTAPDVWLELTKTLVKHHSAIAYRKNLSDDDEIFQVAFLVMIFVDAQIGVAREERFHDTLISDELDAISEAVRAKGAVPLAEFSALVEEAHTRLGAPGSIFEVRLNQEILRPRPRRKLPQILFIHGFYVHSDTVCSLFEQARVVMTDRLTKEYAELMDTFLRGRAPQVGTILGSRDRLNDDVARRIERGHPLLGELLARPQLLAEAVIHSARQRREDITTEELRGELAEYFDVETSALRPLSEILDIDVVGIYDAAFGRTGVLKQILLRISGRHESLRATYVRRFGLRAQARGSTAAASARGLSHGVNQAAASEAAAAAGAAHTPGQIRLSERAKAGRSRAGGTAGSRKPKQKSRQEIEQIWQEFDKAIHSRPSKDGSS
jgi:hypothetical protein